MPNKQHLQRWQTQVLAEAIWAEHRKERPWIPLNPKPQPHNPPRPTIIPNPRSPHRHEIRRTGRTPTPAMLGPHPHGIRVPPLPALCNTHYLMLTRHAYKHATQHLPPQQSTALHNFLTSGHLARPYQHRTYKRTLTNGTPTTYTYLIPRSPQPLRDALHAILRTCKTQHDTPNNQKSPPTCPILQQDGQK